MWVMNSGLFLLYFFIKKSDVMRIENYFVKELKVFFYCYFVENKRNLFVTFLGFPLSIDLNYYFCKKNKEILRFVQDDDLHGFENQSPNGVIPSVGRNL